MKHWFDSLIENGFDVTTLVYIVILHIIYHYLLRWYMSIKFNKVTNQLKDIKKTLQVILETRRYYDA